VRRPTRQAAGGKGAAAGWELYRHASPRPFATSTLGKAIAVLSEKIRFDYFYYCGKILFIDHTLSLIIHLSYILSYVSNVFQEIG
jgi:hypothetical protein